MKAYSNDRITLKTMFVLLLVVLQLGITVNVKADPAAGKDSSSKALNSEKESSKVKQSEFEVKVYAATCLACVRRIERHLRETPGVIKVSVIMKETPNYFIQYDSKKTSEKSLLDLIVKEGYRAEKIDSQEKAGSVK